MNETPPRDYEQPSEQVWRRLTTRVVHHTPWFDVRSDGVVGPDGVDRIYQHVVAPGSVTVLALDDNHVAITRQWIYTHGGTQWRLPGGGIDTSDTDPESAAQRELVEETGLRATTWKQIGHIHGADSISNHVDHVFIATGLTQGPANLEPTETDLQVRWLPIDHAIDLVTTGQVPHAASAYALLFLALQRANTHPNTVTQQLRGG